MNDLETIWSKLTPEQKIQFRKEFGLDEMLATMQAEETLKQAKRRYESASAMLNSEQMKFGQVEAAERQRFEARIANFRQGLDAAELNHAEATQALREAEIILNDAEKLSGIYAR